MNFPAKGIFIASAVVLALSIGLLHWWPRPSQTGPLESQTTPQTRPSTRPAQSDASILVYCAAGMRKPVEAAARDYQAETGHEVQLQYGGSETLLTTLALSHAGDLYIPADQSYVDAARQKDLIAEVLPMAEMLQVLAVPRGNPRQIHSLDDLLKPGVKIALADPGAAAIGKTVKTALEKTGQWDAIKKQVYAIGVTKETVNDVANDLKLGTADAGFVWNVTVAQWQGSIESVVANGLGDQPAMVSSCILRTSQHPTEALTFARYLASRDRGLRRFTEQGFKVVDGDAWAPTPQLVFYAGAMLQPAIRQTLDEFSRREGCEISTVYNGCGILVSQMKAGERPDAYFACDKSFMFQVHDLFTEARDVSMNQLVILVPKANPHNIHELKDLGQPGLKIGVGNEKQCALGQLTRVTLDQSGQFSSVNPNVVTTTPTGDLLVNQLLTGSLDAVIAYVSNATGHGNELTAIKIDIACALATQPVAIGKKTPYPYMMERLMDALTSQQSKGRFEAWGFHWQLADH